MCTSCREVVGFTRRLLDTNQISDVKANLTEWCVSEGPEAPRDVVSFEKDEPACGHICEQRLFRRAFQVPVSCVYIFSYLLCSPFHGSAPVTLRMASVFSSGW